MTTAARPWLAHYPKGVPHEIDPLSAGSIADILADSARRYANRPAFVSFGKALTFAEIEKASNAVTAWLQSSGLKKGDRVAIMMPNVMAYPV